MKTENKIKVFALASAGVFWMSVLDYSMYLVLLILLIHSFQLFGATIRTLRYLFSRKRIAAAIKTYWFSNLVYFVGFILLISVRSYLPDVLDPLLFKIYFSTILLILAWYFVNIYYSTNKRTHV